MARTTTSNRTTRRTPTAASKATTAARRTARKTTSAASRSTAARSTSSRSSAGSARQRTAGRQAASKATQVQDKAASTLRDQLDERSNQLGEQLSGTATDVRQIASQLRTQDNDSAARLADMAAERIDQAAGYLSTNGADALLDDIEDFARSKPWLAAGAAAVAGFAASRALSASRRRSYGGSYVDFDAGSDFDEEDAAAVYPDEPSRVRGRT